MIISETQRHISAKPQLQPSPAQAQLDDLRDPQVPSVIDSPVSHFFPNTIISERSRTIQFIQIKYDERMNECRKFIKK